MRAEVSNELTPPLIGRRDNSDWTRGEDCRENWEGREEREKKRSCEG